MKINIQGKDFEANFGFKSLMSFGRSKGLSSFSELMKEFQALETFLKQAAELDAKKSKNPKGKYKDIDVPFDVLDLIEGLVIHAIKVTKSNESLPYTLDDTIVLDALMADPVLLGEVMQHIYYGIQAPNSTNTQGKQQAHR